MTQATGGAVEPLPGQMAFRFMAGSPSGERPTKGPGRVGRQADRGQERVASPDRAMVENRQQARKGG